MMIPFTACMMFGRNERWVMLHPLQEETCTDLQQLKIVGPSHSELSHAPSPTHRPRPPPPLPPTNPDRSARSGGVGTCRACGVLGCRGAAACCGGRRAAPGGGDASSAEGAAPAAAADPPARRCGLCALVGRALRRAVCGAAAGSSRRSSGDSYQVLRPRAEQPATAAEQPEGNGVTIDITAGNVTYIPVGPPAEAPAALRRLSPDDWALLDAMGVGGEPGGVAHLAGGRFLTIHKRRRKRLATRAPRDHAILDDVHHGQVQKILNDCGRWAFNAFALETVAGGRSLPVLCVHLFHWYGLLDHFHLDVVRVWKLFTLIEEGYHSTNPYHNSIHATDVTQAMHCFLQEEQIRQHLTPLEVMAALIGAVAHDLDHPGVNQHFLITTSNHLAILYENSSVLENHHWRSAVGCLIESGVTDQLILDVRRELERQIRDLILATDINRQPEFLSKFKQHLDEGTLDLRKPAHRQFILQISLKCADISNPTRPWDVSRRWSMKVCEEFFRQGEFERRLNLPVTSICDRQSTSVAKIQIGFFKHMVTPLFSEWHRFLHSRLSTRMMRLLESNRRRWEEQERAEQADETQTVLSDAGEGDDGLASDSEVTEGRKSSDAMPTARDFITPPPPAKDIAARRQSLAVPTLESLGVRRHSVPARSEATTPTGAAPALPRTIYRRESLPVSVRAGRSPVSPQAESRGSSGLREEDELLSAFLSRYGSQSSDLSSGGSPHHSSNADDQPERPLSAENLLPEPSIASMTSSAAVGRLSALLQGGAAPPGGMGAAGAPKCLTRQQTFPPPQPYVRVRYMSATAEMTTCPETPHEGDSRSNSSTSNISPLPPSASATPPPYGAPTAQQAPPPAAQPSYPIPAIAVLSPNNSRPPDVLLAPGGGGGGEPSGGNGGNGNRHKRETEGDKENDGKKVRLEGGEKENMDPRRALAVAATSLSRRRGSAPVSLPLAQSEDGGAPAGGGPSQSGAPSDLHALRRGSVPVGVAHYVTLGDESPLDTQQQQHMLNTPVETTVSFWQCQRRGSAPVELPTGHGLTRHVSLNGKAGRGRKKQLRRRSSGGPETVCLLQVRRCPSDRSDALLAQRRGSLPIEVLTVGHSVF